MDTASIEIVIRFLKSSAFLSAAFSLSFRSFAAIFALFSNKSPRTSVLFVTIIQKRFRKFRFQWKLINGPNTVGRRTTKRVRLVSPMASYVCAS